MCVLFIAYHGYTIMHVFSRLVEHVCLQECLDVHSLISLCVYCLANLDPPLLSAHPPPPPVHIISKSLDPRP